jgi:acyl-CoA thioester hydrolase
VELRVKYVKHTTFGQRLAVHAELEEYENRLKIAYTITDSTGEVVTKASTTQVAVDARGEMCFVSPQALLDKVHAALAARRDAGGRRPS